MIYNISKTGYYCGLCKRWHLFDSKIGIKHFNKYATNLEDKK